MRAHAVWLSWGSQPPALPDPVDNLREALAARERAAGAVEEANRALASAIREANAAGLRGDRVAEVLGMTRANVSYLLKRHG